MMPILFKCVKASQIYLKLVPHFKVQDLDFKSEVKFIEIIQHVKCLICQD